MINDFYRQEDLYTHEDPYIRSATYCQTCEGPDLLALQTGLSRLGAEYYTLLMNASKVPQQARLDAIEAEIDDLMELMPAKWRHHCLIHYWGFLLFTGIRHGKG